MPYPKVRSTSGSVVFLILALVGIFLVVAWTVFGYAVLIAAFFALDGVLQVLMGVYIIGSFVLFFVTMLFKAAARR